MKKKENKFYYWIISYGDEGNRYLISGSENGQGAKTAEEAKTTAFQLGLTKFGIKAYPTMNMSIALEYFTGKHTWIKGGNKEKTILISKESHSDWLKKMTKLSKSNKNKKSSSMNIPATSAAFNIINHK
jgi:hypothetical protein